MKQTIIVVFILIFAVFILCNKGFQKHQSKKEKQFVDVEERFVDFHKYPTDNQVYKVKKTKK